MKENIDTTENVLHFSVNERIKYLIEKILEVTAYEFSKSIGNNRPDGLYRILKNEVEPSPKTLNKIFDIYPQYKLWILTGEGFDSENKYGKTKDNFFSHLPDPTPRISEKETYQKLEELKKKKSSHPEPSSRIVKDDDLVDAIEYVVPLKGQAGMASKFYPEEMIEELKKTVVKVKPEYRGVFYRIEVDGNSMPPKIQPGDWLRCEEISSLFWMEKNFFKKDKIYCVWHNSRGIIFKRLIYKEMGEIWCSSDNEDKNDFPDFPLELEKVNKILIVRKLVDRNF